MRFKDYTKLEDWQKNMLIDYADKEDASIYWEITTEDLKDGWEKEAKVYKAMWKDLKEMSNIDEIKAWMSAIEKTYGIKGDE